MNRFVLDYSVTIAWFFEDEFSDYCELVLEQLVKGDAIAVTPGIWPAEVANVLFQAERRNRITSAKTTQALRVLAQLPVETDYLPLSSMGHVLRLCRTHTLTSYDALYLELALRGNIPLATEDKKLNTAATVAGVELFA